MNSKLKTQKIDRVRFLGRDVLDLGEAKRSVVAVWVVLALIFVVILVFRPNLAQLSSIQTIVVLAGVTAVVGLGQGSVIFVGGIDLSVPWIMSASAIVFASISGGSDDLLVPALIAALCLGALLGAINGAGVTRFGIHPVVMTLALGAILEGDRKAHV